MSRTGQQYIESLRDGRIIYLNGKRVKDPVSHPAFSKAIHSVARLYDYQAENIDTMTFTTPTGAQVNKAWEIPDTKEKLVARAEAAYAWAQQSCGWLGRSPDHVSAAITGMITHIEVFKDYSSERALALRKYYEYARDKDLYLTYTIVNPQGDRSKSPGEHDQNLFHTLGVVRETADGLIVRGAKMLGTAAVLAEELFVGVQNPMKPGIDDRYALSFATPLNAAGIRILSRRSYAENATSFDYPLSHRFDENDAVVYFDNVLIPWDRVFIHGDVPMCRKQFHSTAAEVLMDTQSQARLAVKLHFLASLAQRMTEVTGVNEFPAVREALGNLACHASVIEGLFRGLIHNPVRHGPYFIPDQTQLYACQAVAQSIYPQVIETIRKLAGGGVIMLPSHVDDFANDEMRHLIDATQYSSIVNSTERVQLMKLVWDAIGSEFGSRHTQYEMFYSGPHFVALARLYNKYDWGFGKGMAQKLLDEKGQEITRPKLESVSHLA
ncbi:4-hydroxyphenylacetate 3-hydroxylase family protein [Pseudomonas sp. NPDC089734]|uniref:4-hydroxyphenylacetate 3-hydroxylase family protein n=1 Tax=Pseudomonas sp. NPDC089734 TaxID=3364469 RepID=UPI00380DFB3C